jgi:hypothetical protein
MTVIGKICPDCGKFFKSFPSITYFQDFEEQITEILSRKNVVIWGAGILLHELYQANKFFHDNDNIAIVDSSIFKQSHGFYDKHVFTPARINDMEMISAILYVVFPQNYELFHNHKDAFQNVKDSYWIFDIGLLEECNRCC